MRKIQSNMEITENIFDQKYMEFTKKMVSWNDTIP